jgi:hypothetical protein
MSLASIPPSRGGRERLARTLQQPKGTTNMSAKVLAAYSLAPAAKQTIVTDCPAPKGISAGIQFHEGLWREYRLEAINAGFNSAEATEYANALSSEMGLAADPTAVAPIGRCWFYQSRPRVVRQTVTSGLIELTHCGTSRATGRPAAAVVSILAHGFRWWNAGGKS